jgi:hypothetical protein
MEKFFTPARRLRHEEIYEEDDDEADEDDEPLPFEFTEVQLAVPVELFLNQNLDWSDLLTFMTASVPPQIVWISKDAFLSIDNVDPVLAYLHQLEEWHTLVAEFTAADGETRCMQLTKPTHSRTLSDGESRIFWHTVMTSNCRKLALTSDTMGFDLCSAPVLSKVLRGSSLLLLILVGFVVEGEHCRALATLERTDLEISFTFCTIEARDAGGAFIEWLRHSQVVVALTYCTMESSTISALSGNSSVKLLAIGETTRNLRGETIIGSFARALLGNQGLEHLHVSLSDETWSLLLRSLWVHPRIKYMSLNCGRSAIAKTSMMNAVVQMVRCNTVVQKIDLPGNVRMNDEEFYQNHILPRLEMNRSSFGEQRAVLKRADPSIRSQLLGRALHVVRYNPDLLFRFLSENVPAFVRTEEEDVSTVPLEQDPVTVQNPIIISGQKRKMQS